MSAPLAPLLARLKRTDAPLDMGTVSRGDGDLYPMHVATMVREALEKDAPKDWSTFIGPCVHGFDPFTRCGKCEGLTPEQARAVAYAPLMALAIQRMHAELLALAALPGKVAEMALTEAMRVALKEGPTQTATGIRDLDAAAIVAACVE